MSSDSRSEISFKLGYPTGQQATLKTAKELFGTDRPNETQIKDYLTSLFSSFTLVKKQGNYTLYLDDTQDALFSNFVDTINMISNNGILDFNSLDATTKTAFIAAFQEEFGETLPPSQMSAIFNDLISKVDAHNLYTNNQEAFTKNFIVEQMFRIATNVANLIQAQTSVDQTTDEPKALADKYSQAGQALKNATPGNIGNIYQSIEDNHVGKEVIGISAVGLKSFFAITEYINTLLNTKQDQEILESLLNKSINFGGTYAEDGTWVPNKYYTIANANYKGENQVILEALHSLDDEDSALMLSALLSLATDNAKELCLAKLNANPRMAGMYIYGLTMGIPFRDLGRLLMSNIGDTVSTLLKGSIIGNQLNFNSIDEVLEYINNPFQSIQQVYKDMRLWQYDTGKVGNQRVWNTIQEVFFHNVNALDGKYIKDFAKGKTLTIKGGLGSFLSKSLEMIRKGQEGALQDVFNTLEDLRVRSLRGIRIDQNKYMINEAIDSMEEALLLVDSISKTNSTLWPNAFDDFITLHEGAAELQTLGGLLGANQGVKNSAADYLKFINNLETIIDKRNKSQEKLNGYRTIKKSITPVEDTSLDFQKFMIDEEYRKEKIQQYEGIKASFNPLAIIDVVPHYRGYMDTVFTKHGTLLKKSIKYRTIYEQMNSTSKLTQGLKMDQKIRAISDLCDYKGINAYLQGKYFYISPGTEIVYLKDTQSSVKTPVSSATKIYLGTLGGNATFKNWVEQEVIPNLKQGYNSDQKTFKNAAISNNQFIQSLRPNIYSKNPNKNSSVSYTTSINMSPRNDEDISILQRVRQEFDALTTSYTVNGYSLPIKDIFYLYNLIAYNGKQGQGSLTSIFDNYLSSAEPTKYRKVIAKLDNSDDKYEISTSELKNWVAQIENPYGSKSQYLYYKNKDELRTELLERSDEDTEGVEQQRYGAYVVNSTPVNIDTNLILTVPTSSDIQEFSITAAEREWKVSFNPVTRKLFKLESDGIELENSQKIKKFLQENIDLLVRYKPTIREYVLDKDILTSMIEQQINCQ